MFLEQVTASWAGHQTMKGFPLLPKTLPTESSYKRGDSQITKTRCFRTVRWARVWRRVGRNPSTGKDIWKWKDAYWID
mgnify:CR=1 FL=1